MAGDDKAGSADLPAGTAEQARNDSVLSNDDDLPLPRGLTQDGEIEYRRLRAECLRRFDQDMATELTRYWRGLKIDGPESFTWDRVSAADASRRKQGQLEIADAARSRLRTPFTAELQHTEESLRRAAQEHELQQLIINELRLKLADARAVAPSPAPERSWTRTRMIVGSTLVAGCGAGVTMVATSADDNIVVKLALVAGTAFGAAIWPKR